MIAQLKISTTKLQKPHFQVLAIEDSTFKQIQIRVEDMLFDWDGTGRKYKG